VKRYLATLVLLSISAILYAGTITKSVSSLYSFGNVYSYHSSTSQRYTVSATSLTATLLITADNGFEVSTTYLYGYSKSISITPISGSVSTTTIFVRFSPSATGAASGNIVNSSIGSTTQNVSVSGTGIAWAIPTSPSNYYNTASGTGATLKTNLYNKILGHTATGYTPGVWNAFYTTDVQPNGKVWDIYSTLFDTASPYEFTLGTDQDAGSGGTLEGDKYNREHSFPQSWFGSTGSMQSDLNHVFATDKKVNNVRGNDPYGTVSIPTYTSQIGGKSGPNTYPGYTGTVFEPIDEYKGDVARGYFYMATRYQNVIGGWSSNGNAGDVLAGNSFPAFDTWHVNLLLDWHNLDPVSDKEMKRNNAIYALQNNRNPFIDSPQYANRIWGGNIPTEPTIAATNFIVTNNSNTSVTLNWKSGNGNRRIVIVKAGSAVNSFPVDTFQYAANANINSAPQLGTANYIVYNGTGSTVTLTNLVQGTNYYYAIIEYNGWYTTANYQASGYLTSNATTLPVNLLSFTATAEQYTIILKWITATETNNDFFTIERSIDNYNWEAISTIKGSANSQHIRKYQYLDDLMASKNHIINQPTIYYRLKQTDFNGDFAYSKTATVHLENTLNNTFSVSPNPFSQSLRILADTKNDQTVVIKLQNLIGEIYVSKQLEKQDEILLDNLGYLPAGIYILQIEQQNRIQHFKLIKR
jgi:endonuclease I